nr:RNA-directed DNA polymerase, eukaryota, nucleotide-binding alpha-beta plait domain protein [Tanacetum cinerariifolium]
MLASQTRQTDVASHLAPPLDDYTYIRILACPLRADGYSWTGKSSTQPFKGRIMSRSHAFGLIAMQRTTKNISHSIYVTNFPDSATSRDLLNACSVYGTVVDVFIPLKKSKV